MKRTFLYKKNTEQLLFGVHPVGKMQCSRFWICMSVLVVWGSFVVPSESQRSFNSRSPALNANLTAGTARWGSGTAARLNPLSLRPSDAASPRSASARIRRPITSRISAVSSRESARIQYGAARSPVWNGRGATSSQEQEPAAGKGSPGRTAFSPGSLRSRITASGSQLRNRQLNRQSPGKRTPPRRLIGANVCGRQCCSGWTVSPGTNRCIKRKYYNKKWKFLVTLAVFIEIMSGKIIQCSGIKDISLRCVQFRSPHYQKDVEALER
ncbi:latent-transforming growth factor beta-binding protein 1-like [Rhincodon typus]|uniref:latent-transforming growth factor beta-binding protein 1-like n=1 Tax=Rhincodon typus TaxID=259920 RepID=UPI00202F02DA|nr:latent-transforming growth factor beta-binding protein 1-like [Rhincodon typus]